jgi:membrane protein insertase Oxa1/YidC/SpoIIIJ
MIIKWSVFGAIFGYFVFHPLIHIMSVFHFSGGHSEATNLVSEILQAFSVSMLPWGLAFMVLNAVIGLFLGKMKQADKKKSEVIAELKKALEEIKTLGGFLALCPQWTYLSVFI